MKLHAKITGIIFLIFLLMNVSSTNGDISLDATAITATTPVDDRDILTNESLTLSWAVTGDIELPYTVVMTKSGNETEVIVSEGSVFAGTIKVELADLPEGDYVFTLVIADSSSTTIESEIEISVSKPKKDSGGGSDEGFLNASSYGIFIFALSSVIFIKRRKN